MCGNQNPQVFASRGAHVLGVSSMGSAQMAKPKYLLQKGDKKYRVIKFDKTNESVKLRGELTDFETSLAKALSSGYKLIKESVDGDE